MKKYSGLARRLVCLLLVFALGAGLLLSAPAQTAWADEPAGQSEGSDAQADDAARDGKDAQADDAAQDSKDAQADDAAQDGKDAQASDAARDGKDAQTDDAARDGKDAQADDAARDGKDAQADDTAQDGTEDSAAPAASDASPAMRSVKPVANVVIFARLAGDRNNDFKRAGSWDAIYRQYVDSDNSFANYIYAVSGGRMRVENIFPQVDADGKIEVLQLSKSSYQSNAALVAEVVHALSEAEPGSALYLDPAADTYTLDNLKDGVLDNLTVILQGGTFGSRNGAFAARYTGEEKLPGEIGVSRYNALPSRVLIDWTLDDGTQSKGGQGGQGVLANAFLHTLGLPDQNWIDRGGVPVGAWDVMGTAAYVPQYPLGYQRRQLGWLDDGEALTVTGSGDYTLTAANREDGVKLLLLETPRAGSSGEVICLEYREKASGDAFENGIYTSGLIAYRAVQNGQTALANEFYVYRPGATTLDGADDLNENGRNCVENAALTKDGAAYGSTDLSADFKQDTLYYSDGSNSGVRISGLRFSEKDHTVTFHLEIAASDGVGAAGNSLLLANAVPAAAGEPSDMEADNSGADNAETDDTDVSGPEADGTDMDNPETGGTGVDGTDTGSFGADEPGGGAAAAEPDAAEAGAASAEPNASTAPAAAASGTEQTATAPAAASGAEQTAAAPAAAEPGAEQPDAEPGAEQPDAEPGAEQTATAPAAAEPGAEQTATAPAAAEPGAEQPDAEPAQEMIRLSLTPPAGYTDTKIYVDGIAYEAEAGEGGLTAQLPDTSGKLAVMYFYNENGVPKGMYVWQLSYEGLVCTATPLPGLQDLLSYHGFSIRVQSPAGIRFKSGIDGALRDVLTGSGVDGYRLTEYGTMSIAASNLGQYPFIKSCEKVRSGRSYWTEDGIVNDRITEAVDGRYRFASVLTGVPNRQLGSQIAFRAYAVLVNGAGEEVLVYGPPVARSIYTVAQQVAAAGEFQEGSDGFAYVQQLAALGAPGWHTAGEQNEQNYYISPSGQLAVGLQQVEGQPYYFDAEGDLKKGWQTLNGNRYYFDENTGVQFTAKGWQSIGGMQYYFTADGYVLTGDAQIDGVKWHLDAETGATYPNGWNTINGQIFYYENGTYLKNGLYEINQKLCHFTAEGYYVSPPVINSVLYISDAGTAKVTITATASALTELNENAYSWDGGASWTAEASREFTVDTKIDAGQIQVRDALGNISAYASEMTLAPSSGPVMGIDVSSYQGPIDWKAVKASGVEFAVVRALTWSNSAGYYVIDPYFEYNVRNAKANGIKVGAYLFTYAFNPEEIQQEVEFFHNSTQMQALRTDNIKFDYPVYIDFEWGRILEYTDYTTRTQIVRTGMILLEKYGYQPGFYSSQSWAQSHYDALGLAREGYDFWVARYPKNDPNLAAGTASWLGYQAEMWQYASDGRVDGITGNVDMNICYKKYDSAGGATGSEVSLGLTVYDVNTSKVVTGSVEDVLTQIVANEVSEANNAEVYKAQAVAAYSWILYQQEHGNAVPGVGLRTTEKSGAVRAAVQAVVGQVLYYDGAAANAAYGSASAGKTNTARNMWGLELPYLNTPVESPETEWRGRQNTISLATMQSNLIKLVDEATVNATPHDQWLTEPVFDENGYLTSIKVCGQTVGGGRFYENCWGLYSPKCTFVYTPGSTPDSDSWVFTTDGNGHCVGMSQFGAAFYATKQNWNYQQILEHYYPGTTLQ